MHSLQSLAYPTGRKPSSSHLGQRGIHYSHTSLGGTLAQMGAAAAHPACMPDVPCSDPSSILPPSGQNTQRMLTDEGPLRHTLTQLDPWEVKYYKDKILCHWMLSRRSIVLISSVCISTYTVANALSKTHVTAWLDQRSSPSLSQILWWDVPRYVLSRLFSHHHSKDHPQRISRLFMGVSS